MTSAKISSGTYTDMNSIDSTLTTATTFKDSLQDLDTDGISGQGETTYVCDWSKWHGIYREIPELQSVIDKKALWSMGKGYKADAKTKEILSRIKGNGKDTFNSIISNMIRTYTICGDSYAEIIRDKAGRLINLKPLSPGSIRIVINDRGFIDRYEQINKTKKILETFQPKEMLHFCWNRIADETHGIGTIEKIEDIVQKRKEAMNDMQKVFHRYVKPLIVSVVNTDDTDEITAYKVKIDKSVELGENLVLPKDTVDRFERVSIPQYSTLDPLPWIKTLETKFIISEGVPNIVLGEAENTTEASGKILYLAFEQMVEWNQLFVEDCLKLQLNIEINLKFPASIAPELLKDNQKDPNSKQIWG